jgi:hypothetical protein
MKRLLATLALIPSLALAEEPSKWTTFTKMPDGTVWEFKNNSLNVITNDSKQMFWIVQFRTHQAGKTVFNFVKVAVPVTACKVQSGQLVLVGMDNVEKAKIDFVFDGGTLASNIAQSVCRAGDKVLQKYAEEAEKPAEVST